MSWGRKLGFGVGGLGKDLCYAMISTYLTIYLTDTVGLAPLFVGNLFLVARIWDVVNDPMMGFIVDNTHTRWGKFRPWILIGTIVNAVILALLFRGPQLTGFAQYAYYSVMYILWGMTYTVLDIPYWSMLPSMSSTKEERDSMSVIPRIFASSAWLLIGAFGLKMIDLLGNGNESKGYANTAVVVAVIFVVTLLVTVIFSRDRSSMSTASTAGNCTPIPSGSSGPRPGTTRTSLPSWPGRSTTSWGMRTATSATAPGAGMRSATICAGNSAATSRR